MLKKNFFIFLFFSICINSFSQKNKKDDSDGDGVLDINDKCKTEFGLKKFKGCPDTDRDGVPDYDDDCKNEKGPIKFFGCPDSDKDGFPDNADRCKNEKGTLGGCPDKDKDGLNVLDDDDDNEWGPKDNKGRPYKDSDGDGVLDHLDECWDLFGTLPNGCPELKKVTATNKSKQNEILFESGSSSLKESHKNDLKKLIKMMNKDENIYSDIIIEAFAEEGENSKDLLNLAEKRAKTVKKYLIENGLPDSRIISDYKIVPRMDKNNKKVAIFSTYK